MDIINAWVHVCSCVFAYLKRRLPNLAMLWQQLFLPVRCAFTLDVFIFTSSFWRNRHTSLRETLMATFSWPWTTASPSAVREQSWLGPSCRGRWPLTTLWKSLRSRFVPKKKWARILNLWYLQARSVPEWLKCIRRNHRDSEVQKLSWLWADGGTDGRLGSEDVSVECEGRMRGLGVDWQLRSWVI